MTKTALITGASRGLGLALARSLAADGWRLILTARGEEALRSAAGGLGALALAGDVADPAHRDRLVRAAEDHGGLDLLVNNASGLGAVPLPPLSRYPLGELEELLRTNVLAPLALIQAALPGLRERHGAIVNVTSDAAVEAYEGWGGYGGHQGGPGAALQRPGRRGAGRRRLVGGPGRDEHGHARRGGR
ncbi:SDR family NAD(P)-dependent oxidoreductase [Streptosporangium pseudovulgare]|nr:SDR family oxidoreductase [Streptosporangium pseudovulgare]